ncbi:MAG TPA: hypothetical protein ACFYDZ_03720 [Candidatus Brocadiaceae bacterium]
MGVIRRVHIERLPEGFHQSRELLEALPSRNIRVVMRKELTKGW